MCWVLEMGGKGDEERQSKNTLVENSSRKMNRQMKTIFEYSFLRNKEGSGSESRKEK